MKFKKYRKFIKKEISFIKFFYKIYNKEKRNRIKYYDILTKLFEIKYQNIYCYNAYSNQKEKNFLKKINIYNMLKEIFENEENYYKSFSLGKNKKTSWSIYYYDDTNTDYEGQPYGNSGIEICHQNKHNKYKKIKIILNHWY